MLLFILIVGSRAAGGKGAKFFSSKYESSSEKSTKVVGVTLTVTNNTPHTLTFSYNGVTTGSFTVGAHSSYNGKYRLNRVQCTQLQSPKVAIHIIILTM